MLAIQDIHPLAPVHILLIPRKHIDSMNTAADEDAALIGHMLLVAARLAHELGVSQTGYRLVFNTGPDAHQTVQHLHLHLIGGRSLPFTFQ